MCDISSFLVFFLFLSVTCFVFLFFFFFAFFVTCDYLVGLMLLFALVVYFVEQLSNIVYGCNPVVIVIIVIVIVEFVFIIQLE